VTHSKHRASEQTAWFNAVNINERVRVADREGSFTAVRASGDDGVYAVGPGLPYRTDADPRVNFTRTGGGTDVGFDRKDAAVRPAALFRPQGFRWPGRVRPGSRLIRAENLLARERANAYITLLDSLRASPPSYVLGQQRGDSGHGGTHGSSRRRVAGRPFFKNAPTGYGSAVTPGDMRPVDAELRGPHRGAGISDRCVFQAELQYDGTDVNFPVPIDEENNPQFTQCTDRLP